MSNNPAIDASLLNGDNLLEESLLTMVSRIGQTMFEATQPFLQCFRIFSASQPQPPLAILLDPRQRGGPFLMANRGDATVAANILQQYDDLLQCVAAQGAKFLDDLSRTEAPISRSQPATTNASTTTSSTTTSSANGSRGLNLFATSAFTSGHQVFVVLDYEEQKKAAAKEEPRRLREMQPTEDSVSPLEWWSANHTHFPLLSFVAKQILGIPGSAISVSGCLALLAYCHHYYAIVCLRSSFIK